MLVSSITFAPSRQEAGDETFVLPGAVLTPPPAANDNGLADHPRIIGLMGYAGSGKTTVANILRKDHGFKGPHIKEPLRFMAGSLLTSAGIDFDMVERYLDGDLKREVIPEFRRSGTEIQQFLGTEFGRDFCYPELWLDIWLRAVDRILSSGGRVVQESVRFANEADSVRVRGGVVVLVERPGVGPHNQHQSEHLPTDPDIVLHNNGSINDLRARVREIAA